MLKRLLVIGLVFAAAALAQRGGGGGGRGGDDVVPSTPSGGQGPQNKTDQIAAALNMDKDQKKNLKAILEEGAKEAAPLRDAISKSRVAVGEAIVAKKSDEELKQVAQSASDAANKLSRLEIDTFGKVVGILDDSQKKNIPGISRAFTTINGMYRVKNWNDL